MILKEKIIWIWDIAKDILGYSTWPFFTIFLNVSINKYYIQKKIVRIKQIDNNDSTTDQNGPICCCLYIFGHFYQLPVLRNDVRSSAS